MIVDIYVGSVWRPGSDMPSPPVIAFASLTEAEAWRDEKGVAREVTRVPLHLCEAIPVV